MGSPSGGEGPRRRVCDCSTPRGVRDRSGTGGTHTDKVLIMGVVQGIVVEIIVLRPDTEGMVPKVMATVKMAKAKALTTLVVAAVLVKGTVAVAIIIIIQVCGVAAGTPSEPGTRPTFTWLIMWCKKASPSYAVNYPTPVPSPRPPK